MGDEVNHPDHYTHGEIETIDAIIAAGYGEGFCAACVIKYIWRYKHKGTPIKDIKKAIWYAKKLLEIVEGQIKETS